LDDNPLHRASGGGKNARMSNDGDYVWRPIERGDAANWSRMLAAVQAADHGWDYLTEQVLLEEFDHPDCDFERGSVGVFDGGTMVGYAGLIARPAAGTVHEMRYRGAVHPGWRGRGIGGRLLDWAEAAAVPLHRERYPDLPLSLSGWCLASNAPAIALYAAHGYQQVRWFHAMMGDLSAALPSVPEPDGVDIVGFTPERSADARLIRDESFRDHWGSVDTSAEGWAHSVATSAFRPGFSFIAYGGGEPAGVILCHEYDAPDDADEGRDLHVALVGTLRAFRKRRIASALLVRAMAKGRAAGYATASLGVDADSPTGAVGVYAHVGFTVHHTSITLTKPLLCGGIWG
jgi:GNAT superfamily N-acetyltransferase